jgi:hypothetical protein
MSRPIINPKEQQAIAGPRAGMGVMAFIAGIALAACSGPADTPIPSDVAEWDSQLAPALNSLKPEERDLASGYLARVRTGEIFGGEGVPVGMTIGKAIGEQRLWLHDQREMDQSAEILSHRLEAERAAAQERMSALVDVGLLDKYEDPRHAKETRYHARQILKISVANRSDKALAGISGDLEFVDASGASVGTVYIAIREKIKPGGEYVWVDRREYDALLEDQKAIWNLKKGNYQTRFTPHSIVFADETKLVAPE